MYVFFFGAKTFPTVKFTEEGTRSLRNNVTYSIWKAVVHYTQVYDVSCIEFLEYFFNSFFLQNWIYAWTLPQHLSQSRFGGRRKPSSACTIIALAMVRVYHRLVGSGNSSNKWYFVQQNPKHSIVSLTFAHFVLSSCKCHLK
uniref:Transmembrane protein n=1 Tax=Angiostrongylus cantonensis TaxID=6313 RepID=A0A0K0DQH8_ANGCA